MKELSLHILDIAENSVRAGANLIEIQITEDTKKDEYTILIKDDGKGMDDTTIRVVEDPFYTTRTTRKVGMGISLLKAASLRCDGDFKITSQVGVGTSVCCMFKRSHIDRAPLGSIEDTIMALISKNENFDIIYTHKVNEEKFVFNTKEISKILDGVELDNPEVIIWIRDFVKENVKSIHSMLNT